MRLTNLSGFQTIKKLVTTSGTPEVLSPSYSSGTIAFNNNSGTPPTAATRDTITDSSSQFLVEGFNEGDKLVITGSASNNIEVEIYSVVDGTITITGSGVLTTEIAGSVVTIISKNGIKVEDGVQVVIKANSSNTGTITLASTSAKALNTNSNYFSNYRITASQSVALQVKNLNSVWIDSTVSGEGVEVVFEK